MLIRAQAVIFVLFASAAMANETGTLDKDILQTSECNKDFTAGNHGASDHTFVVANGAAELDPPDYAVESTESLPLDAVDGSQATSDHLRGVMLVGAQNGDKLHANASIDGSDADMQPPNPEAINTGETRSSVGACECKDYENAALNSRECTEAQLAQNVNAQVYCVNRGTVETHPRKNQACVDRDPPDSKTVEVLAAQMQPPASQDGGPALDC
eukprot:TRINITY_DN5454_c0_g1_i1.p1 TRINITY_DN5454_c0_g1~~TRINITY_DN5454_c0_g1_i1.p1  ORF type:complete len:214 (+),score=39.46 TRINITY_DN5454_c0_g1_i1:2-643(+)